MSDQSVISVHLRPATPADTPAVVALAVATGLFLPDQLEPLHEALAGLHSVHSEHNGGAVEPDQQLVVWVDVAGGPPVGAAYFGPDAMTDQKWDLWMIAVAPERQGQGIGGQLLGFAEAQIRASAGRLLLIDTSSLAKYNATHAFYLKHGYSEVARIPDFYADGDSKVVFAKKMT
jgi:ribosomal protein S18 acetylase RimI-like enzyme